MADEKGMFALCCCGTPLVFTVEFDGKEWWCVTCDKPYEWLHARRGSEPNPTPELEAKLQEAEVIYAEGSRAREERRVKRLQESERP